MSATPTKKNFSSGGRFAAARKRDSRAASWVVVSSVAMGGVPSAVDKESVAGDWSVFGEYDESSWLTLKFGT